MSQAVTKPIKMCSLNLTLLAGTSAWAEMSQLTAQMLSEDGIGCEDSSLDDDLFA